MGSYEGAEKGSGESKPFFGQAKGGRRTSKKGGPGPMEKTNVQERGGVGGIAKKPGEKGKGKEGKTA